MKKESLFAAIDQRQAEILSWGDTFFDCAELGFQEVKTGRRHHIFVGSMEHPL